MTGFCDKKLIFANLQIFFADSKSRAQELSNDVSFVIFGHQTWDLEGGRGDCKQNLKLPSMERWQCPIHTRTLKYRCESCMEGHFKALARKPKVFPHNKHHLFNYKFSTKISTFSWSYTGFSKQYLRQICLRVYEL